MAFGLALAPMKVGKATAQVQPKLVLHGAYGFAMLHRKEFLPLYRTGCQMSSHEQAVTNETLFKKFQSRSVEPVISTIRFPRYKALAAELQIEFSFPITALVGANGTNKSSILHALQSAPQGRSVSDFWFSTAVDDIDEKLTTDKLHRFIYKYRTHVNNTRVDPECRKSRVSREYRVKVPKILENTKDPDYWEPTKIATGADGMTLPPPSNPDVDSLLYKGRDRWHLIQKNVVYLDFRSELSAFDKFLYHAPFDHWAPNRTRKKLSIVAKSGGLARAFKGSTSRKIEAEKILERRSLSKEAVTATSAILGKEFTAIDLIHHRFYRAAGYSARLTLGGESYSEAHAGSGEFAVVRLVDSIDQAPDRSLILLDEPEVSLHPGAQHKLMDYVRRACLKSGHQVVISTHSPSLVSSLPPEAIKLLGSPDGKASVELLSGHTHPSLAFFHLGHFVGIKGQKILVEDDLSAELVKRALRVYHTTYLSTISVLAFPGGADGILKNSIPSHALSASDNILFLLDGDKIMFDADWSEIENTPIDGEHCDEWVRLLKTNLGVAPNVFPNGNSTSGRNPLSTSINAAAILRWSKENLFYLHGDCPEASLLFEYGGATGEGPLLDPKTAKDTFLEMTREYLQKATQESLDSTEVLEYQKHLIANLEHDSPLLLSVRRALTVAVSRSA